MSAPARHQEHDEEQFLLRSLDDLEQERREGNIDDATYERLHADYTARAAALLRGRPAAEAETAPSRGTGRRVLVAAALVVFAGVCAVALAFGLGARLPGQEATGRSLVEDGAPTAREQRARLEAAAAAAPADADAQLALGRFLLSTEDYPAALRAFDAAAAADPSDGESRAYGGWILFLVSQQAASSTQQAELVAAARARLDEAVTVAPDYPDAHFFRGMVLYRGQGDAAAAVPSFQRYLVLEPDGDLGDQVRAVLARAVEDAGQPVP